MSITGEAGGFEPEGPITSRDILNTEIDTRLWPIQDCIEGLTFLIAEAADHESRLKIMEQALRAGYNLGYMGAHLDMHVGPQEVDRVNAILKETNEEIRSGVSDAPEEDQDTPIY
jgi:hypothetical protein